MKRLFYALDKTKPKSFPVWVSKNGFPIPYDPTLKQMTENIKDDKYNEHTRRTSKSETAESRD